MKRYLFVLILFLLLLVPVRCYALQGISIYDTTLTGPSSATEGELFTIEIGGIYSGFDRNIYGVEGIYAAGAEFEFDDSVLEITQLYTDYYDSAVAKIDGKYYVYGVADESENNKCADNFLDCTPYSARIVFFVKDTYATEVTIKLNVLELDVFTVRSDRDYDESNMKEVVSENKKTLTVKINQSSGNFSTPNSIVSNKLPVANNSTIQKSLEDNHSVASDTKDDASDDDKKEDAKEVKKKNIKFLKSLSIKNYKLNFKEDVFRYVLTLDNSVNKLKIDTVAYDKDAKVNIVGANNLEAADDTVKIRVKLSTGEKATYTINIKRSGISSKNEKLIVNKLNYVIFSVIGVVILILVLVVIFHFREKRKLNKLLNEN